jgi:HEAT repeat protein
MTQTSPSLNESLAGLTSAPIGKAETCQVLEAFAQCDFDILRVKAVQGLRDLKATDSVPLLIQALRDDDEDVRVDAAESLGLLGDTSAIPALIENLTYDPCAEVKQNAVQALGLLNAKEAAPLLRQLVTGRGEEIQWDEDEYHRDEWDGWLDIQIMAIDALAKLKDVEAIEPIMLAVNDPENQDLSVQAMDALAKIGDASLPSLGVCAQSSNRRRRFHAVRALATMPSDKALELLEKALDDADHDIRILAFETLLKRKPSVELFERALEDNSDQVRMAALAKLDLDQMGYLQRALSDPSPKVQLALIRRLSNAQSGTPITGKEQPFFKALYILFENSGVEVSSSALGALAALAPELIKQELKDLFERSDMPKDEQEQRQWAVVDGLSKRDDARCLEWLQQACGSASRSVRLKALASIGMLAGKEELNDKIKAQALAVLIAFGRSKSFADEEIEQIDEDGDADSEVAELSADLDEAEQEEAQPDLEAMKDAGLDLGHEKDQSEGPTSSLGAILGHEAIAKDLIEEAEEQEDIAELSLNEQALLNRARRNLRRRKIDLDGDAEQIEQELCLTAIHLMGEHDWTIGQLMAIAQSEQADKALAALEALTRLADRSVDALLSAREIVEETEGEEAEESDARTAIEKVVFSALTSSQMTVQKQGLRLLAKLPQDKLVRGDVFRDLVEKCLQDSESTLRIDAMPAYLVLGGDASKLVPYLQDASTLVRQATMRLLAQKAPNLAIDHIVDFLLGNPEQTLNSLLGEEMMTKHLSQQERQRLASSFARKLTNDKAKAEWTIILPAMTQLYA